MFALSTDQALPFVVIANILDQEARHAALE
jgi:hypothetical protein